MREHETTAKNVTKTYSDGQVTTCDEYGNPLSKTFPDGRVVVWTYEDQGYTVSTTWPD
jgi:YD repeat-containing protein